MSGPRHGRDHGGVVCRDLAADRDYRQGQARPRAVDGVAAVAAASGGPRPDEGPARLRAGSGCGWGLPFRYRVAVCRARIVRLGGLASDGVAHGRPPRRRRCRGVDGDRHRRRPQHEPAPGHSAGTRSPDHAADAARPLVIDVDGHPGDGSLGQAGCCADVQEGLRAPSVVGVRRPRPGRHRGARRRVAAPGQRRVEHRC